MRTMESLERRQLLAWSAYASLIGQDTLATTRPELTGKGQVVAVIDTGIDYTHPDLGGAIGKGNKVIYGYDWIQNDRDPQDSVGHGTAVAGFIAGNQFTYQGTTYRGIAPDAKLIALRTGTGRGTIDSQRVIDALNWCVTNREKFGITVVNMSLGFFDSTDYVTAQFSDPIAKLKAAGVFVVAASGNDGFGAVGYPGSDVNAFSVGSVDAFDTISDFSNRSRILDLLAPGEQVLGATRFTFGYAPTDGTSFATPITAGAVALIKQAAPTLSVDEIASVLRTSSVWNRDGDNEFFPATSRVYGRLDLPAAINLAVARAGASLDVIATTRHTTIDTAYDSNNVLHMAYYEPTTRKLMYSVRNSAGKWLTPVSVDTSGAEVGQHLSLEIDQAGHPAIAYYDATNADLKYATLSQGSVWSTRVIDWSKSAGQTPSLAFNASGEPNIAYYSKSTGRLRFATYTWQTDKWSTSTIDGGSNTGLTPSLAMDSGGRLAVAYADKTNGDLRYATRSGITWTLKTVDNLQAVGSIDLSFNGTAPIIVYQDQVLADVKYAWIRDTQWKTTTLISSGDVGRNIETYYDSLGQFHVVYYNADRRSTYNAIVQVQKQVVSVASTSGAGNLGPAASVAVSARDRSITIVGLSRNGSQMFANELVDAV